MSYYFHISLNAACLMLVITNVLNLNPSISDEKRQPVATCASILIYFKDRFLLHRIHKISWYNVSYYLQNYLKLLTTIEGLSKNILGSKVLTRTFKNPDNSSRSMIWIDLRGRYRTRTEVELN